MKKKKKILIIIIIVVVLALAGAAAFLFFTGKLFGDKNAASSSSVASSQVSSETASSAASMSGDAAASAPASTSASAPAAMPTGDPTRFYEGHFYFQNLTGQPLEKICISPAGTSAWEDNLLGDTLLDNGETWSQTLMLRDIGTLWDLRATDINGQELVYTGLDMGANTKFALTIEGDIATLRQAA